MGGAWLTPSRPGCNPYRSIMHRRGYQMKPARGSVSRRMFGRTLAGAAAGALLPLRMEAQKAGRIDVHHHFTPPFYVKAMEKELSAGGFNARPWTPAVSLEAMDRHNIAT